jgi:hypothetical protein
LALEWDLGLECWLDWELASELHLIRHPRFYAGK